MKKIKKKKKLALGAYLEENQAPIAKGAMLAGQIVQNTGEPTSKPVSIAGTALSRAGQGAQLGSAFGPWGTVIGGAAGAIEGTIEGSMAADAAKRELKNQTALKDASITKQLMSNAKNGIAKGGKLASKLGVIQGGELNQISPDAVEVKANNPSQTDSVELQNAYVDHDEIIDNKNRVFSEELGFAKYAKKLEKQKNDHPRFSAANNHIDNKLDNLFQVQEQTKEGMKQGAKTHKAKGGYLRLTGPFPMKTTTKAGFALGTDDLLNLKDSPYTPKINQHLFRGDQSQVNTTTEQPQGNKFDLDKGLTALSTFGPNVVSSLAQNRLVGPANPQLERNVALQRINPNAQLAEADRDANQSNQLIKNNTAQASDIASATGNILAKKFANKNAIYGQNQQLNAGIQAQEAGLNSQIGARNVERTNAFTQGQADFSNLKQRLTSENVANLSGKILQQGREKNQMQLDKDKTAYTSLGFKESGVLDRGLNTIKEQDPEQYKRFKSQGFARGGNLSNRPIYDSGLLQGILGLYSHPEPHNAFKFENNEAQNLQSHKEKSKHGKSSHKLAKGGYVDGGIEPSTDPVKLLKERTHKRDSVRNVLYTKFPHDYNKVNNGMLEYMQTEPDRYKKLSKQGFSGGGETPNDPKKPLSRDDFKRVSWKSQGVQDSTGRGDMYQTTYSALNRLNNTAIPQGVDPMGQTFVTNPLGLNRLPTAALPALNIAGSVTPQAGALGHFLKGGSIPAMEGLGDPRHIEQTSSAGQDKAFLSKGGIHIKKSHKGLLHKDLGVPKGQKIPKSKLKVHSGDSPALKKRKIFAQNFGHKK